MASRLPKESSLGPAGVAFLHVQVLPLSVHGLAPPLRRLCPQTPQAAAEEIVPIGLKGPGALNAHYKSGLVLRV